MRHFEALISLYALICVLLIAIDLFVVLYEALRSLRFETGKRKFDSMLEQQFRCAALGQPLDENIQREIKKRLFRLNSLIALNLKVKANLALKKPAAGKYIAASADMIASLAAAFDSAGPLKRASLANLAANSAGLLPEADKYFLKWIKDKNVYCRQNALLAVLACGEKENVVKALKEVNSSTLPAGKKLLLGGLATYKGDREELCASIWKVFDSLDNEVKAAAADDFIVSSASRETEIYALLSDAGQDKEVRLAAMRYFGRHAYEPAADYMAKILTYAVECDWQYLAVAARQIRLYKTPAVVEALKAALFDLNWYVRTNSAESLAQLGVGYEELARIYEGDDRFAKEAMMYRAKVGGIITQKGGEGDVVTAGG